MTSVSVPLGGCGFRKSLITKSSIPGGLRQRSGGDGQREGVHHLHDDNCRCSDRRLTAVVFGPRLGGLATPQLSIPQKC